MDLRKAIQELYDKKRKLDQIIVSLEAYLGTHRGEPPRRRGRKSMGEEERQAVSARMRRYWAARRDEEKSD